MKKKTIRRKATKAGLPRKIGYAIVGCGWISQVAALPAFAHAKKNSKVVALVSSDPKKLKALGKKYQVSDLYSYEQYEDCLRNPAVDAVYIALPNSMHEEYVVRAAEAGKHVLCEKPMSVTIEACKRMYDACRDHRVKLMIAYRLHFDPANLQAVATLKSGKIGTPRLFSSIFSYKVLDKENSRLKYKLGGGPLFDIGIYCINAARYLLQSEPTRVLGTYASGKDPKFKEVEETLAAVLEFPDGVLAQFICSFGCADEAQFEIIGTKGKLIVENAYSMAEERRHYLTVGKREKVKTFKKSDQFAPEFLYFSDCVLNNKNPEPSGVEGFIDVYIIQSIYESVLQGRWIALEKIPGKQKPNVKLKFHRPAVSEPELVNAEAPAA